MFWIKDFMGFTVDNIVSHFVLWKKNYYSRMKCTCLFVQFTQCIIYKFCKTTPRGYIVTTDKSICDKLVSSPQWMKQTKWDAFVMYSTNV